MFPLPQYYFDYFEGDLSFMCLLSIKVPIRKKCGNLFNDPRAFPKSILLRLNIIA